MKTRAASSPDHRPGRLGPIVRYMLGLLGLIIVTGGAFVLATTYYDPVDGNGPFRATWGGIVFVAAVLLGGVAWTWTREKDCPILTVFVAAMVAAFTSIYGWYGPYLLLNGWLDRSVPVQVTTKIERLEEREYRSKNRTGIAYYAIFPHWENPSQMISLRVKLEQAGLVTSASQVQARVGRGAFGWEYWVAGSVTLGGIPVK